jgi:hypothetical protein
VIAKVAQILAHAGFTADVLRMTNAEALILSVAVLTLAAALGRK